MEILYLAIPDVSSAAGLTITPRESAFGAAYELTWEWVGMGTGFGRYPYPDQLDGQAEERLVRDGVPPVVSAAVYSASCVWIRAYERDWDEERPSEEWLASMADLLRTQERWLVILGLDDTGSGPRLRYLRKSMAIEEVTTAVRLFEPHVLAWPAGE